ncbi:MAG TPA: hypothetical protein VG365_12945 [Solirubrobacteraceae bacterium]|jgi:hypothetical protein|nr:hypothetical protein [Solirubrobacteraceae bacterium]
MSILAVVDTVLLVIAIIFIVALLRSHADILRRLAILEEGGAARPQAAGGPDAVNGGDVVTAEPISATTLDGDSVTLSFGAGSPVTLLAFLTSGCTSCAPLWAGLREAGELESLADRVVVVTHDPTRESPARVRRLAPAGAEVVMSSQAWEDYGVPASPHFVLTDGRGGTRGRGSALSWSQLEAMVDEARSDASSVTRRAGRTTAQRAAHAEHTLAEAGIGPGHPSLFPSTDGQAPSAER